MGDYWHSAARGWYEGPLMGREYWDAVRQMSVLQNIIAANPPPSADLMAEYAYHRDRAVRIMRESRQKKILQKRIAAKRIRAKRRQMLYQQSRKV